MSPCPAQSTSYPLLRHAWLLVLISGCGLTEPAVDAGPHCAPAASALEPSCLQGASGSPGAWSEVSEAAGIVYRQHNGIPECVPSCMPLERDFCEAVRASGGVAVGDVDADGRPDLFVTRLDAPAILYKNLGDGSFADVTAEAGIELPWGGNGAAFADIDNDGDLDLFAAALGPSRYFLFVNQGDGSFVEEAEARGLAAAAPHPRSGFSVAVADYDGDGFLDFHTTSWAEGLLPVPLRSPPASRLFRNLGAAAPGRFEDVTDAAGVALDRLDPRGAMSFTSIFADLDDDGHPDLAVAGDFGTSRLFWNRGDGSFEDGTDAAGVGTDENGMGATIGDFDGDGRLDWFVTSIHDPEETCVSQLCAWGASGNRLYRNLGGRSFADDTDRAGVREGGWGWGTAAFDFDNDGDLDLAMTNGMVIPAPDYQVEDQFNDDRLRLWRNRGDGSMEEISAEQGIDDPRSGKAMAVLDYDQDGDLDLFVVHNACAPALFRNEQGAARAWLRVRVIAEEGERDAVGATVWVEPGGGAPAQRRVIGLGGYLTQHENVAHFGLGELAGPVQTVRVRWPSGRERVVSPVATGQTLVIRP